MTGEAPRPHPAFIHRALLYESARDFAATVAPFVDDGRRRGCAVLVVTTPENVAALRDAVELDRPGVRLADARQWYAQPALMFTRFLDYLHDHRQEAGRIRVVGEQVFSGRSAEQIREMARCEAVANLTFAFSGAQVMCPYRVSELPQRVVDDVRRTHPELIEGGVTRRSEPYIEPAAFVRAHHHDTPRVEPTVAAAQLPSPFTAAAARQFVTDQASTAGVRGEKLADLITGANEVVSNALEHAVPVDVRTWVQDGWFICEVRDYGFGLTDPLSGYLPPSPNGTSGRGLWLARHLTDAVEIFTGAGGTNIRLHTRLL